MKTYKTRTLRRMLLKKGFREDKTHHRVYWLYAGEKKTSVKTRLSHGIKEYGDDLLKRMMKQLKLSTQGELESFLDCPMDGDEYLELLIQGGEVIPD